jgi:hypothetical protein
LHLLHTHVCIYGQGLAIASTTGKLYGTAFDFGFGSKDIGCVKMFVLDLQVVVSFSSKGKLVQGRAGSTLL